MRNEPPPRRSGAMACHEGGKLEIYGRNLDLATKRRKKMRDNAFVNFAPFCGSKSLPFFIPNF